MSICRPIYDFSDSELNSKRGVVIVLAVMLLFLSIALFSPLHRHVPGKAGGCSFNNLEHQWYALLEFAVVVLILLDIALREWREELQTAVTRVVRLHRGRAPPLAR